MEIASEGMAGVGQRSARAEGHSRGVIRMIEEGRD